MSVGIATEEQFTAVSSELGLRGSGGFERVELGRLRALAESLLEKGVGLVGCQRVVHPLVKQLLGKKVCWDSGGRMEGRRRKIGWSQLQSGMLAVSSRIANSSMTPPPCL